ncbi:MAG: hypothetical protein Q7T50_07185 [Candidatus Magasanikbacteria bacterium]|nr:hypothetical protein [Candidatus Magasanikbacteria bacterium]
MKENNHTKKHEEEGKMEIKNEINKSRYEKFIIIGLIVALVLFGLWVFGDALAILTVYPWLSGKIAQTGLNIWLARALSLIILSACVFFTFPQIFSLKSKTRKIGYVKLMIFFSLFMVGMYLAEKDRAFDQQGVAIKCYTINPTGEVEFCACSEKVHPQYGTPVLPVTKTITEQVYYKNNTPQRIKRVIPTLDMRLFSADGTPLFFFYQYPDGRIELFDKPGHHPNLATPLHPLTPEIAMIINQSLREGRKDMIVTDNPGETSKVTDPPTYKTNTSTLSTNPEKEDTTQNDDTIIINEPCSLSFQLKPGEKLNKIIYIANGFSYYLGSTIDNYDFFIVLIDQKETIHINSASMKLPTLNGGFTIMNGENNNSISLLVTPQL